MDEQTKPLPADGGSTRIAKVLETVVGIPSALLVALSIALLAVSAVFVTCYAQMGGDAGTITVLSEFGASGPVRQIVVPLLVAAGAVAMVVAIRRPLRAWSTAGVVIACLVASLAIQCVWTGIFMTGAYHFNDTIQIDAYAQALNSGDMSLFVGADEWTDPVTGSVPSYLIRVPYQAGMVWLFAGIYQMFGAGNLNAIMVLNIVANMVSIGCLLGIVATTSHGDEGQDGDIPLKLTALAVVAFLPFLMSATFVYSNAIAFAFMMLACLVSAMAWARDGQSYLTDGASMVGAAVLMALAIMLKQTFMLFSIVLFLCWLVHVLRRGRPLLVLPVLVMGYAFLHAVDLPIWCLEQATGVDFGDGQPLFANITVGLTWSQGNNAPGWYNPAAMDCYNQTDGSIAAQTQWCLNYIGDRLGEMKADPGYAAYFFRYKIASEWLDPTYQSCWFSACAGCDHPWADWALNNTDNNILLVSVLDGIQTVIYALSAVGFGSALGRLRRHALPLWQLMLVGMTLIGLVVYLLWEAQAMYILPFAFMMLPMAAIGGSVVYNRVDRKAETRTKAKEGHDGDQPDAGGVA